MPPRRGRLYRSRGAAQASALLLFRSCRLDNLIDLPRRQSAGFVTLGLIANDLEDFRLRGGKFDIIADIQENGCGCTALLNNKRTPFNVDASKDLPEVGAQTQG